MRKDLLGAAAACFSSCLGGASVVATRAVIGLLEPATLAALRYGLGALCLLLLVFALRRKWPERRDLLPIVLLGMLFFTGFPYLFNLSLSYTTAARGSLALSTLPFLTLLVAAALRSEQITSGKLAGVAAAIFGVVIALGERVSDDAALRTGDLLMVATALCGAFYNVLSRSYIARTPALTYTTTGMIAGTAASTLWALVAGAPERILELPAWAWMVVAFLGLGGAALTFFLWSYGLEHTTPTVVATTVTLNPVVAILLGNLLLGEPIPARLALGLLAIVAGIVLVSGRGGSWTERLARLQRRRYEAHLLSQLDTRTLRDVGLLGREPRDRHHLARPFWWLPPEGTVDAGVESPAQPPQIDRRTTRPRMSALLQTAPESPLVLRDDRDGVATLTLNRPAQRNALSLALMTALQDELDRIKDDASVKVVVIAGAGPGFCGGHDLKEMRANPGRQAYEALFAQCSRLMLSITQLPKPVIARVHAVAAAAGCQLVATCDLAVASESARFAVNGVNIGLFCSTPMVALTRAIGRKQAMEMLLTGDLIDARTALEFGLVNKVVPDTELDAAVDALTRKIVAKSPLALAIGKEAFYRQAELDLEEAYRYASEVMTRNMLARDTERGIDAFIAKQPMPKWEGR